VPAPAQRPWALRLVPLLGGLAMAAAAVLLLLVWPAAPPPESGQGYEQGGLRIKGGLSVGAFVKRGGTVQAARSGQVFHPGDELRFTYSARGGGYFALVGLDAADVVTLYHPTGTGADRAVAVKPGAGRPLPGSTILDATLGPETVVGVLCPRPFPAQMLRRRASRLVAGLRHDGHVRVALLPADDCQVARFELDKRPAPVKR